MTQPPDDAALVARLRKEADSPESRSSYGTDWCEVEADFLREAATALEAKDRRIADLEAALAPFAKAGHLFGPLPVEGYEEGIYSPAAGPEYSFGGNALRAARAALEPSDKGVGR